MYKKGDFPGSGPLVWTLRTFSGKGRGHNFGSETVKINGTACFSLTWDKDICSRVVRARVCVCVCVVDVVVVIALLPILDGVTSNYRVHSVSTVYELDIQRTVHRDIFL